MKKKLIASVFVLCIFAFIGLMLSKETIQTVHPSVEKAMKLVYAIGEVEPVTWAKISASITETIEQIHVHEGEKIKEGQVLAQKNATVEEAALSRLKAKMDYLKKQQNRYSTLVKKKLISKTDFEEATSNYLQAAAEYEAQYQQLQKLIVRSPINGILLRRDIEIGELARQGETIFWVGELQPLQVTALVDEEDMPYVKTGQKVLIKLGAYPDEVFTGIVGKITPKGDPEIKQFRVRIRLPSDTKLLIGMTVEVNIIIQEFNQALMVPRSALYQGMVLVKTDDGIRERKVETGIETFQKTQIISNNLSADDAVILYPKKYQGDR